jgi:hypothetical protein
MNEIFLSYKRSDDPGYVARLADSLEQIFGEGTVYRDVDSVQAGANWKKSLARTVSGAEIVLAVIGPSWQELLAAGPSDELDWVRFELNQAHELEVPVIPVRLAHTEFDNEQDLQDLAWLKDLQFFELADGQGRWDADLARLAEDMAKVTSLEISEKEQDKGGSVSQVSHGKQSPNIVSEGDVTISFGKD